MKKFLILGGAGFIGFHLAKHLIEEGRRVTICDNLLRGKLDNELTALLEEHGIKFINLDLTRKETLKGLDLGDYECIFHLVAINGTKYFYEIPHEVLRVNILSLLNFLDLMKETNYLGKFIWTSSSEVYAGSSKVGSIPIPTPEDVPLAIANVFNPRFSYAASKIAGELLCINYARTFGFDLTMVRPHNIYGPRMHQEHVIPEFILRIVGKEDPFKIFGGKQTRAFCYINDFVEGLILIAQSPETKGEIINLGNDKEEITTEELAQKLFNLSGFYPCLETHPAPEGSVDRRCPDITKARTLLGYEPQCSLDKGLEMTYKWYLWRYG